jgi:vacuolar iron transporter family protein
MPQYPEDTKLRPGAESTMQDSPEPTTTTSSTTAAHLESARRRARGLFAAEVAHDRPYELVHAATAGRDAVVIILLLWAILRGVHAGDHGWPALLAAAIAMAVYTGISNAIAIYAQLRYWESELVRERDEIRAQPEFERDELRELYRAKGFSGELLEQVIDTICSDEERLLKVMLEEELGIFFEQRNHPVLTGAMTATASLVSGLAVALAAGSGRSGVTIGVTAVVLAALCVLRNGRAVRDVVESFARWAILAGVVAGMAYLLGKTFVGLTG